MCLGAVAACARAPEGPDGYLNLAPGAAAEIRAYGRCALVRNRTVGMAYVPLTAEGWPAFASHAHATGKNVIDVSACKSS